MESVRASCIVMYGMLALKQQRCWNSTVHIYYLGKSLSAKSGRAEKAHAACIMSVGYSVAIKSCLFSSAQEKIKKKSSDMFIKQQGSHYYTQQSLSQCSHIVACTCSLGTLRLIVSLLSFMHFILSSLLHQLVFPFVCSMQVAHIYYAIFRLSSMFVKGFKLLSQSSHRGPKNS